MWDFGNYHKFAAARRLEKLVRKLNDNNAIADEVMDGFNRYHHALIHKIQCAQHHAERLCEKLQNTDVQDVAAGKSDFAFVVNMSIDGFFHAGNSALDIVSREVLIYFGQKLQGNIYYSSAYTRISKSHQAHAILSHIDEPPWLNELREYRNSVAHELLLANLCNINLDLYGSSSAIIKVPLPDDPRAEPAKRKYNKNPDVVSYTKESLRRLISHINKIYTDVCDAAEKQGSLPLR